MMTTRTWLVRGVSALGAWMAFGLTAAGAAPIAPSSGSPALGLSIQLAGADVTDSWLPEPGQSVTLAVSGADPGTNPIISLVCPDGTTTTNTTTAPCPALATVTGAPTLASSNYPGICTNFGDPGDLQSDYALVGSTLTPSDCGGRAVIQVDAIVGGVPATARILAPRDTDNDGVPDAFEAKHCPAGPTAATCLVATADAEAGPGANLQIGDGFPVIDEYRGFFVSPDDATSGYVFTDAASIKRKHIRTDQGLKDIFIHLVRGQCAGPGQTSLLGGGPVTYPVARALAAAVTPSATTGNGVVFTASADVFKTAHIGGEITTVAGGRARIISLSSPTTVVGDVSEVFASTATIPAGAWQVRESIIAPLYTLLPAIQVHLLGTTGPGTSDQWVDKFVSLSISPANAVLFTFDADPDNRDRQINRNSVTASPVQKGGRLTECLDAGFTTPMGLSAVAPLTAGSHNAVIYTQRVINLGHDLMAAGGSRALSLETKVCGGTKCWVTDFTGDRPPTQADKDYINTKLLEYYVSHELGHSIFLNSKLGSYGPHNPPGTGDVLDASAVNTVAKSPSGTNNFRIPLIFTNSSDFDDFRR